MPFVYGALGAVFEIVVGAGCFFFGWKVGRATLSPSLKEPTPGEQARRNKEDADKAFQTMLGYNMDMVYGIMDGDDIATDGGDAR